MSDIYFIKFLWLMKNYISPLEGIIPLLYKKRDYSFYEKIINFYIEINKAETPDRKMEIIDKIKEIYDYEMLNNIAYQLTYYAYEQIKEQRLANKKIAPKIHEILSSADNTDIDKINFLLCTLMENEEIKIILDKDYNRAKSREDENEDLTSSIASQLKDFIPIFCKLQDKPNKNKNDINTYIIASTEFFNATNHLANALLYFENIDAKCIRKNLHQAQGHLSRATKDMEKLDMYLGKNLTLKNFKKRIKEVLPSNIGC